MGFFDRFRKKSETTSAGVHTVSDDDVVAIIDGNLIDISTAADPVFAQKMMGDGVAFTTDEEIASFCAPADGILSVLYPTGHAYGVTMKNGTELLVHIGIDTVEAKGDGFTLGDFRQGDEVHAGDVIVTADLKKLKKSYDCTAMLINTTTADHPLKFIAPAAVKRMQSVIIR